MSADVKIHKHSIHCITSLQHITEYLSEFFAISGCGAYFNSKLQWKSEITGDRPRQHAHEIFSSKHGFQHSNWGSSNLGTPFKMCDFCYYWL